MKIVIAIISRKWPVHNFCSDWISFTHKMMDSSWSDENTRAEFSEEEWFPNVHHQPFSPIFVSSTSLTVYRIVLVELYYVENQNQHLFYISKFNFVITFSLQCISIPLYSYISISIYPPFLNNVHRHYWYESPISHGS